MTEMLRDYWPAIIVAVLLLILVSYFVFRPRQRVRLSDSAPVRPHMAARADSRREGNSLADEAAAAAGDLTGQFFSAPVHANLGDASDDFERMKGVGPKFADMLRARGYTRFDQLARLTTEEIAMLDPQMGAFRGRISRDRLVEQADYLARGDDDGFEQTFGKL